MQLKRQANTTARAKAIVDRTKVIFSAITSAIRSSEPKAPSSAPPTFEEQLSTLADYESDSESTLFYPTPLFAARPTSGSQRSGSTKSTSTAPSSIFSRHTYRTAVTVAGEGEGLCLEKEDGVMAVEGDMEVGVGASGDESSLDLSSEDDDEDEGVIFMRSKRVNSGLVTSLPRNPYAAFLSQPLYKPAYSFPTARRSVDDA